MSGGDRFGGWTNDDSVPLFWVGFRQTVATVHVAGIGNAVLHGQDMAGLVGGSAQRPNQAPSIALLAPRRVANPAHSTGSSASSWKLSPRCKRRAMSAVCNCARWVGA